MMLGASRVKVIGRGANVEFALDDAASFSVISNELRHYLRANRSLYVTGAITLNVGRRELSQEQLAELTRIVQGESGLKVERVWRAFEPGAPAEMVAEFAGASQPPAPRFPQHNEFIMPEVAEPTRLAPRPEQPDTDKPAQRGKEALLIKTNCRSGEIIRYNGDVVALADVNPGAEIIADGDIVVMGKLRGLAHAGASGDISATIIALKLEAPRLRIGPYSGLAPAALPKGATERPKIAYVRQRSIYVADYAARFTDYARGILYEG